MKKVVLTRLKSKVVESGHWPKMSGKARGNGKPKLGLPYVFYSESPTGDTNVVSTSWITHMHEIKRGRYYGFDTIDGQYLLSIL